MFYCLCGSELEQSKGVPFKYKEYLDQYGYTVGEYRYKLAECKACGLRASTRELNIYHLNSGYVRRGIVDEDDYTKADDILPGSPYTSVPNGSWSKRNSRGVVIKKPPVKGAKQGS